MMKTTAIAVFCAALLARQGIRLYSEKDMTEELLEKLLAEDKNARQ